MFARGPQQEAVHGCQEAGGRASVLPVRGRAVVSGVGTVAALLALRRAGGGHEAAGHGGPRHGGGGGRQAGQPQGQGGEQDITIT